MKQIAAILLALLLISANVGMAADERIGLSDVIKTLETPFKIDAVGARGTASSAIVDFEADFFQESRLESLDRLQRGRGRVAVLFDRTLTDRVPLTMFYWEYDQPTTQEIISDGKTLWVYLPENAQVIESQIDFTSRERADDPTTFLTGLGNISRDFLITWAEPNQDVEGNYILELRPRRTSAMMQKMQIVVDRDAVLAYTRNGVTGNILPILASTVTDPNGNRTTIEFNNVRVNRGLSSSRFRFILPAGVEVLRPTGSEMGF